LALQQRRLWSFLNATPVIEGIAVHNMQLQRTVTRRHVRACGAHDTAARGR
jgi:hypothetical protein